MCCLPRALRDGLLLHLNSCERGWLSSSMCPKPVLHNLQGLWQATMHNAPQGILALMCERSLNAYLIPPRRRALDAAISSSGGRWEAASANNATLESGGGAETTRGAAAM